MHHDFFVAVTALFPLLVLTKIGDRHRRQTHSGGDHNQFSHQMFIVLAVVGEVFALAGAATEDTGVAVEVVVVTLLVLCGLIFAVELLRNG